MSMFYIFMLDISRFRIWTDLGDAMGIVIINALISYFVLCVMVLLKFHSNAVRFFPTNMHILIHGYV